jgi:hypothetical protein
MASASETKAYEDQLGDALEALLGGGAESLEDLAAGLNARGSKMPGGEPWTAASLDAELKRLGA